jgi:hypothetical protein
MSATTAPFAESGRERQESDENSRRHDRHDRRLMGQWLSEHLGQQFEQDGGRYRNIAAAAVVNARSSYA